MQLQLSFNDPLSVSTISTDTTILTFSLPDLFLVSNKSDYLFKNKTDLTIRFKTPTQFPSLQQMEAFKSLSDQLGSTSMTVIVITLLMQIVAKKIISSMLTYFFALQLTLFIYLSANFPVPASVELLLTTV